MQKKTRSGKDEVDTKNNAENMVMQCESTLEELGDKVPASEKADVESKCNDLKEALKGTDTALIKQKSEDLQKRLCMTCPPSCISRQVLHRAIRIWAVQQLAKQTTAAKTMAAMMMSLTQIIRKFNFTET